MVASFGLPPQYFSFEYVDKDKNYHIINNIKPLDFYHKYGGGDLLNYVSIINSPTDDKPFHQTYGIDYLGNVIGGHPIRHLNLPMNELKDFNHQTNG
ncbi:MAG: C1 family peptidase [Candidatus Izemoplasmatales bacterium]